MRPFSLCFAVVVLLFVFAPLLYGADVDIPCGAHQLQWKMPPARDIAGFQGGGGYIGNDSSSCASLDLQLSVYRPTVKRTFTGLISSKAMIGSSSFCKSHLIFLLDESKGTGKGYDTVYLAPESTISGEAIDVAQLTKIKIGPDPTARQGDESSKDTLVMLDDPADILMNVVMGGKDACVTKQAGFESVMIYTGSEYDGARARVAFRGRWLGRVDTPNGSYATFQTHDGNWNGIFNDKIQPVPEAALGADYITVNLYNSDGGSCANNFQNGVPNILKGKLFVVESSASGEMITLKPYSGDVGRLQIKSLDGFGRQVTMEYASINGQSGDFHYEGNQPISVPTGTYRIEADLSAIKTSAKIIYEGGLGLRINLGKVIVSKDKTTVITTGGSLTAIPAPNNKQIFVMQNEQKRIAYSYVLSQSQGELTLCSPSSFKIVATIVNAKGKIVWKGEPDCEQKLLIPATLKPGSYILVTKVSNAKYQKPTVTYKALVVNKSSPQGREANRLATGHYKLTWTNMGGENYGSSSSYSLKVMTNEEAGRFTGASLNAPIWGEWSKFTVILDRSSKDASEYDSAYVLWDVPKEGQIDISKAIKTSMSQHLSTRWTGPDGDMHPVVSSDSEDLMMQVPSGDAPVPVSHKVKLRVEANMYPDENGIEVPYQFGVITLTRPVAVVSCGKGKIEVVLTDQNSDGRFSGGASMADSDIIEFVDPDRDEDDWFAHFEESTQPLGKIVNYRGNLYSIKVDPAGDSIDINAYTGPTGRIEIDAVNAKGERVDNFSLGLLSGTNSFWIRESWLGSFVVPSDTYDLSLTIMGDGREDQQFSRTPSYVGIKLAKQITVGDGKEVSIKIGGPLGLEIEPGKDSITAKPGEEKKLEILLAASGNPVIIPDMPSVRIINSAGATSYERGLDEFSGDSGGGSKLNPRRFYSLKVPKELAPGTYTLEVTQDTRAYQGIVTAKKALIVE